MIVVTKRFNYVSENEWSSQVSGSIKIFEKERFVYKKLNDEFIIAYVLYSSMELANSSDREGEVFTRFTDVGSEVSIYVKCGDSLLDSEVDKFNDCETLAEMIDLAEKNNGYLVLVPF